MRNVPYLSAIGTLQYLCTMTRPDIAKAVSFLGCFSQNPGPQHWLAVKHLFRYLQGTKDYKLTYAKGEDGLAFTTYCDASHGDCVDTGRSTGAYLTCLGGGAIGWSSKLQTIVTLSTTEAEYIAACSAGQEAIWMRAFLTAIGYDCSKPTTIHIDNLSAVSVANNPTHQGRMKHLDLRFHWLREAVEREVFKIQHIPTAQMPADVLTKPLKWKLRAKCSGWVVPLTSLCPHASVVRVSARTRASYASLVCFLLL